MRLCAMSNARHASLAGQLIVACGGVPEILRADACRVGRTQLYEFMDPRAGAFMPADVIADLEAYCGQAIYSAALKDNRPTAVEAAELLTEAMEATEASAELMGVIRRAAADQRIDAGERKAIDGLIANLEQQLRELRAANERGRP